jgi:hypothetical protein
MRIRIFLSVVVFITTTVALVHSTSAQEGILIAYGDHFELVCEDNGLISVTHIVLETANITQNVTSTSTYSIKGTLVGEVRSEYDPEIREPDILYKSENGVTTIFVNFSVTLMPLKFVKLKLFYKLSDILKNENGTWHLRYTFNTDAISPPEIVVKIPKPSQFNKLIVENTVPSPQVFIEESHYYSLVYKAPLFKFGNTSSTSLDISYKNELDFDAIKWWVLLQIFGWTIAFPLGFFAERIWRIRLSRTKQHSAFEVFRDKEGKFRFRLKAANGEIIATSESYETKRECLRGIESVKVNATNAATRDTIH